ncbi:MAG TPA: PrsW family intramembrane metalloprotease [Propionibacteriaceae bacterium]|nr:PrsW family intramembrane metalloprotease [Propionibacteriaceae bacterium]
MADALRTDLPGIDRFRRLSGVEAGLSTSMPLADRLLRSRWLWSSLVLVVGYIACLVSMYLTFSPDKKVQGGTIPGLNWDALTQSASYAWPTLAVWSVIFLLADRFHPQRLLVWFLTLGWGASVATFLSLHVNSWAAEKLAIADDGQGTSGAKAAIYIAPFVEEAAKATVLFLLAFVARQRLTSKLSMLSLAGLSAIGFAFTENIIYYARAIVYGSTQANTGDVEKAVQSLVFLRGVMTSFGHPLFTAMTGLGLAVGLRSRSKVVRVVAPLAGFLVAALLHMVFNTAASIVPEQSQLLMYFTMAVPMVLSLVGFAVMQVFRERKLIGERLTDYVRMGWLPAEYPRQFSRLWQRARMLVLSPWWGSPIATYRLVRTVTELAYLRDSIVRGVVDQAGLWRERELFFRIRELRAQGALDNTTGLRPYLRRPRAVAVPNYPPPAFPGPAGIGGSWPAPQPHAMVGSGPGATPLGSAGTQYSAVDPRWGPPT